MINLEKIIKDRLTWDDTIDESQIDVSVKDGIATLKGCVSSYLEKVMAEIETKMVPEITSVINEIEVSIREEMQSDQDVREAMYCLLDANSEIDSNDVKVTINNGNLILEGTVDSYWKRDKIQKMATHTSGVISVTNNVSIIPKEKILDEDISNFIVKSLQNSVRVDADKINVRVKDGIVILSGIVSSMSEHDAVVNIVKSTKGVIEIIDEIKWILRYQTT